MTAQAIGSLFVSLGLDSAAFQAGIKQVQDVSQRLGTRLQSIGAGATEMGKKLSVVSAAMAAVGGAGLALVKGTADAGKQISLQAQMANAGVVEFQRWAAGAKTVGIEQDKLADILKDVNDRVGDFITTGGGPMKDFFEQVAPKVGVTAEQFAKLSGPEALQLYVSSLEKAGLSQQEMTFYMEAMASDATALLPLLANGGAEMTRYGEAAAATGAIMSGEAVAASVQFQEKLGALMQSLEGLRNRLGEALLPVVTNFLDVLTTQGVPAMQKVVDGITGLIQWFGDLPTPVQEAAGVIAAALGVGGPILLAVGALASGMGALVAATGPIGLFIGAAALLTAAWVTWGDDIKATVGASVDWIKAQFDALMAWFEAIPGRMLDFGRNIVQGLIDGIMERWEALKAKVVDLANSMPEWVRKAVGIQSPSRVMREIGGFISEGLALGITDGAPGVMSAVDGVVDAVSGGGDSMASSMKSFGEMAKGAFQGVISGSVKVKDALKQLASQWLANQASGLFNLGWTGLMKGLGIPGFANGTQNFAGGLARVNERGGEIMNLPRGTQVIPHDISKRMADSAAQAGGRVVKVIAEHDPGILMRVIDSRVDAAKPGIVSQAVGAARYDASENPWP